MTTSTWTEADTKRAKEIGEDYQKKHDVSDRRGQTVGIDPLNGRLWFGKSAKDILLRIEAEEGRVPLLYVVRVGYDYYVRKGGRRERSTWSEWTYRPPA